MFAVYADSFDADDPLTGLALEIGPSRTHPKAGLSSPSAPAPRTTMICGLFEVWA